MTLSAASDFLKTMTAYILPVDLLLGNSASSTIFKDYFEGFFGLIFTDFQCCKQYILSLMRLKFPINLFKRLYLYFAELFEEELDFVQRGIGGNIVDEDLSHHLGLRVTVYVQVCTNVHLLVVSSGSVFQDQHFRVFSFKYNYSIPVIALCVVTHVSSCSVGYLPTGWVRKTCTWIVLLVHEVRVGEDLLCLQGPAVHHETADQGNLERDHGKYIRC